MAVMLHTSGIKRDMNVLWAEPMQRVRDIEKFLGIEIVHWIMNSRRRV